VLQLLGSRRQKALLAARQQPVDVAHQRQPRICAGPGKRGCVGGGRHAGWSRSGKSAEEPRRVAGPLRMNPPLGRILGLPGAAVSPAASGR
jgi:hypothetical protein